jgi:quercetin dioxygenase-like cupin family protein
MTVHQVRRVVTGQTEDGKSVFVSVGSPPRVITMDSFPGDEYFLIWSTDSTPQLPTAGEDTTMQTESLSPGPLGTRFLINRWPPGTEFSGESVDTAAHKVEAAGKMHGIAESQEDEDIQMHTTETIDYGIVLKGEMWVELDDGAEEHLGTGDCIIQNGTRHAWRNRGSEECVMAFVMVGANRTKS